MSNQLFLMIDQISREKGIDPQIVVEAIEDAIVVASRKYFKSNEELRSRINSDSGEIEVFAVKTDGVDPGHVSGDVPGLDDRQVAGLDFGDDRAIELGIMQAVFRTMQQPGPDKPVVVIDGSDVIDALDPDRFLLQQLPAGVVAVDRVRGGGEVMLG